MTIARAKVPKQVGRYQLVYELAPSYLGPLWAARIDGGETLALLRIVSLVRLEADTRVRLLEAAWQAMEVRDARVAPVTDVVASDGELCVVSEYVEGLPLRAALSLASVRRKPMPVAVVLRFLVDLADGVIALHGAMTELGDEAVPLFGGLSVDSVLIGVDGRASLLDVSIASAASGVDILGRSPERAAYAAPEQLGAEGAIDARTDVFSLGTMAWEMLSNRRLFVGSDKAVAQKVLAARVPKLEDALRKGALEIPKALNAAVLRALSAEPLARFPSMEAFRTALDDAGVVAATPEEAATYVATIAEGALSRTRDALSPPSKPQPSEPSPAKAKVDTVAPPRPTTGVRPLTIAPSGDADGRAPTKIARPAPFRPNTEQRAVTRPSLAPRNVARPSGELKAVARPSVEPKPVARPSVEPSAAARSSIEPSAVSRPSVEPKSVTTSARVSIGPKANDGWRALEAPPSARSVPPANVRPRQVTMIGLPPPAGLSSDATPPATPAAVAAPLPVAARAPVTEPSEPPPSSNDGSEEPTQQYSREHLKQLSELRAQPPSVPPAAPVEHEARAVVHPFTAPTPVAKPARSNTASEVPLPRLVTLQPTPRPLSEIHTERPPPPEPEPGMPTPPTPHIAPPATDAAQIAELARAFDQATSSPFAGRFGAEPARAAAPLPPASADAPPVRVAPAPPPARLSPPTAAATPSFVHAATAPRPVEQPVFSRPPPSPVSASYYPSQISPPLIHDPRANRAPAAAAAPPGPQFTRGVVLGVVVSLGLVVVSAAIALFFMSRHDGSAAASEARTTAVKAHNHARTEAPGAHPAGAGAPAQSGDPAAEDDTDDRARANTTSPTSAAAPPRVQARAPSRAAAHTTHAAHEKKPAKKHGRFVPDDI